MDARIFIAVALGLVAVAFGGFYFALSSRSHDPLVPTATIASAPGTPGKPSPQSSQPGSATAESIEAEIARSDHAELQTILKKHFADDYRELIKVAVQRRNEGASEQVFGQELFNRFQEIMRTRLKFAAGASTAMIDRLAANEVALFHALGHEGAGFCLRVLGKDETPSDSPAPESVRHLMRLGTLYRFQAIVEGMATQKTVDPLTADEMGAFEASLSRDGLRFEEVRTGAFLNKDGSEPGKPCQMIEKLYLAIARLPEVPRRKIYAGMFFLGRDR